MRKSTFVMTALAATLMVGSALAQTPPAGGGMGGRGQYTQEERAMMFLDQKGMTAEQVADMRTKQRAMSDEERAKQKADLDSRWAKLSATQQAAAIAEMPAGRGPGGGGGGGQGGGQ